MSKDIKEYTPEELQAIGKRVVEARQKVAAKEAENRKIMKKLWKLYQDGKVKVQIPNWFGGPDKTFP